MHGSGSNPEILGAWPGTVLPTGDYYTYTITETEVRPVNIIFNDNDNGHQTIDLVLLMIIAGMAVRYRCNNNAHNM